MKLGQLFMGTGVALVTPFTSIGTVDFNALERLVNSVIEKGVNYLVVLGTTGETPVLTLREKLSIVEHVKQVNDRRVPIVVGVSGNSTRSVMEEIGSLQLKGIDAILSASPYYNKPSQEGIFLHYQTIAETSNLPMLIYNVPGRTGSNIAVDTILRLAKEVKNIIGIKEASGNMLHCMHLLEKRPGDFLVLSGDDHLALAQIALGMDGAISVAANCFPKEVSNMVKLCLEGDFDEASLYHYRLLRAFDLLIAENNPAGVKAFLAVQGMIENVLRLPLVPVREELFEKIKELSNTGSLAAQVPHCASLVRNDN